MAKKIFYILKNEVLERKWIAYILFFITASYFFYFLQSAPKFTDPDSFYHVKMAVLMKERGVVKDFPWLPYTLLKDSYTDHHLLYHLALIPFILFLPPLFGAKLATIIFASATIVIFYWLLKKMKVQHAWFFTVILMVDSSFIFRLNLVKAQALAIGTFFIAYYFILKRRYVPIFFISFFYVWLYGGWPLIFVLAVIDIISKISEIFKKTLFSKRLHIDKERMWKKIRADAKLLAVVAAGLASGIIINPYFPKNLIFYWNQIVKIALVNYQSVIGVGGEWSPYAPLELITNSSVAIIVLVIATTFFILNIKKRNALTMNFLIAAFVFFVLTMKSRRNLEYFIPIIIAFSGVSITSFLEHSEMKNFFRDFALFLREQKILLIAMLIPAIMMPYIIVRDYFSTLNFYENGLEFDKYEAPMKWLLANSAQGSIVFHSDWDEFPMLFYHNSQNYYIVGLDTRFMYAKSPELYKKWDDITRGREKEKIHSVIKDDFKAEYVFVDIKRHEEMDKNIRSNFKFKEVFNDEKTKIYKVL